MGALVPVLGACLLMDSLVLVGRYVLTLRLMLAIVRRKLGLGLGHTTRAHTRALQLPAATQPVPTDGLTILVSGTAGPNPSDSASQAATLEDLGFVWPAEAGAWSPSYIPVWLQAAVRYISFSFSFIFPFSFFVLGDLRADQGTSICAEYVRFGPPDECLRRMFPEWPF